MEGLKDSLVVWVGKSVGGWSEVMGWFVVWLGVKVGGLLDMVEMIRWLECMFGVWV